MVQTVKRAYRYRFYPTPGQAAELSRTFGCVRYVYNRALAERTRAWYTEQRRISYADTSAMLTAWKQTADAGFLAEVSSVPLQQTLRHLQTAFAAFWEKRARYPVFKSRKRGHASAEYTRSAFRYRDGRVTLAKMTGPLNIRWSRPLPERARPSTVTVSRDQAGRWHVSLLVEETIRPLDPAVDPTTGEVREVGLDAGITALATLSSGEKVTNPRHEGRDRNRLAKAQKNLARKAKGSKNRAKARLAVARIHARIADRRRDHLHKLTTRLVRENQTVMIEDLYVRGMLANHTLARAVSDAAWGDLRRMLEYKCGWYGRDLVVVDRFFPSSKTCSQCGHLADRMPLGVRDWTCPTCGAAHDRDVNAARNILAAGRAAAACGAGVRPQRRTPGGRSAVKQETQPVRAGIPSL